MKKSFIVWIALIIFFAIVIVFSLRGKEAPQDNSTTAPQSSPAPSFSLELLDGTEIDLSRLKGKVVVLNFSGSW